MSGECEMCGEYISDCTCEEEEKPKVNPVLIIDKLNRLGGLLTCLELVVNTEDFQSYTCNPHDHLILSIQDGLKEVAKMVKEL